MNYIKRKFDICKTVAWVTIKEYIAYRTHMLVSLFVGPVYFAVQYFIWGAIYGNGGEIAGIEYAQMIRYFGITALIGYLTWGSADWNLSMLIRTGKFLTFALRPIHHRFFAMSQKAGHRSLALFMEFLPCAAILMLVFNISLFPAHFGWFALSVILASVIHFFIAYCIGLFSFWVVRTDGLRLVYRLFDSIFAGFLIPLVFFPKWMQLIQFFLPFQYTAYVPAMVFLGEYKLGGYELTIPAIVGIQALAALVMFLISQLMYKAAIKRFAAVGA